MTLNEWVDNGNNMLSHATSTEICWELNISVGQMRMMELADIFKTQNYGKIAEREIRRYANEHKKEIA